MPLKRDSDEMLLDGKSQSYQVTDKYSGSRQYQQQVDSWNTYDALALVVASVQIRIPHRFAPEFFHS